MASISPTPASEEAARSVATYAVVNVEVPEGYFHEYNEDLGGYIPSMLRVSFEHGVSVVLGATILKPFSDERIEIPVIEASAGPAPFNEGLKWQVSTVLSQHLVGASLGLPAPFLDQGLNSASVGAAGAPSSGWRFQTRDLAFEIIADAIALPVGCIAVRSPGLPRVTEHPTGSVSWPRSAIAAGRRRESDA